MAKERSEAIETLLGARLARPLHECRVLDVGCGYGNQLGWFNERGVQPENLFGVDLLAAHIESARKRYPTFNFMQSNAEHLNFPSDSFDIIVAFTIFSSLIDSRMAENVAAEMLRVLKKSGAILWYDLRYPNPRNSSVRAMTRRRINCLFWDGHTAQVDFPASSTGRWPSDGSHDLSAPGWHSTLATSLHWTVVRNPKCPRFLKRHRPAREQGTFAAD